MDKDMAIIADWFDEHLRGIKPQVADGPKIEVCRDGNQ